MSAETATDRDLTDQWGKPFADYELRIIASGHADEWPEAAGILGFDVERFEFYEPQAASCRTCGLMFAWCGPTRWRAHREQCGWPPR